MKTLKRFTGACALILSLLLICAVDVCAQSTSSTNTSPIDISTQSSKTDVTVGEHVVYKIRVRHTADISVQAPNPREETFAGFEQMDFGHDGPEKIDGLLEETFWFKLRGDRVGHYSIQNIKVPFVTTGPSGETIPGEAKAPPHTLQVRSVLYQDGPPEDIRDIKPIVGSSIDWRKFALQALAGLLFLSLVMALIKWWRRFKKDPLPETEEKTIPPHELALRELQLLIERGWVEEGHFREFAFELSEIFRRYLEGRFDIPALDWTTQEILFHLTDTFHIDTPLIEQTQSILNETDQMKFAKAEPELAALRDIVKMVKSFIQVTSKPSPAKEPVPSPA